MTTSSMRKGKRRNECGPLSLSLTCVVFLLGNIALAQIYLPNAPPELSQYGQVVLDNHAATGPGPVVFDHWLHRSRFTCRVCHVEIGFAMEAKATGITATSNRQGFHCGACHDGKRLFEGKPIFAACSSASHDKQCERCHSLGKKGVRKYEYKTFTARFPKGIYGVNWEAAEESGIIKPVDFIEGLS
ncbi:MAG: cytochrome c3 family protein, partial [Terriglobales bacterium]